MATCSRLKDLSDGFVTRADGEAVRAKLIGLHEELGPGDTLSVDFDSVMVMTPSFADECFGKLAQRIGAERFRESLKLVNANETVRTLVNAVLSKRLSDCELSED